MSRKGILLIIVYIFISVAAILLIFFAMGAMIEAAVAVALFVIAALGSLLFQPIRDELDLLVEGLFIDSRVYRICIFGRAGSGKTTFIKSAFTLQSPKVIRSTETFAFYLYRVHTELTESIDIGIADYKGQKPSQIIHDCPADFFGSQGNRTINAVLFFVDLVPRKQDEEGNPLGDEQMSSWLKEGSTKEKIESRIKEHYLYINEAMIEVLFSTLHSKNLRSVRLVINKIDLVDSLVNDGYFVLGNFSNAEEYALHKFDSMIKELTRACSELRLDDFSVAVLSSKQKNTLSRFVVDLLDRRV